MRAAVEVNTRQIGSLFAVGGGTMLAFLSVFMRDDISDGGRLILTDTTEFLFTFTLVIGVLLIILGFVGYYEKELHDLLGIREGRRYCPGCGHRINKDASYCENCGRELK